MTTYTAIPNGDVDAESPITTTLMTLLRDNPIAITEGASGAPTISAGAFTAGAIVNADINASAAIATSKLASDNGISQTMLAPNCVGQSEVNGATNTASVPGLFLSTGGLYSMGHTIKMAVSGGSPTYARCDRYTDDTTANAEWNLTTDAGSDPEVILGYINSSPPYNLGDGEIPLFIYARIMNGTGKLDQHSVAPDPIWAYNGPTNIVPSRYGDNGKVYRQRKDMSAMTRTLKESVNLGGAAVQEYLAAYESATEYEEEITQSLKHADMDIVPSAYRPSSDSTLVMIDPVSPVLEQLLTLRQHDGGELEVTRIIRDYMVIGNTALKRKGPRDILITSMRWKKTV